MEAHILPDVLQPGLKIVFCGTAAGRASAELGCYYAHTSNKFWTILAETALTDRKFKPHEFRELINFGIGLTDLCKNSAGSDREIRPAAEHRTILKQKILEFGPTYLAFTSLEAGRRYFGRTVRLGLQEGTIAETVVYVLPSTSPLAAWNWSNTKNHWTEFARQSRATGVGKRNE